MEQADMRDLGFLRQRFRNNAEAVVLAGDFNLAGGQVLDRLVGAAVTEFHLLRLAAKGESQQLMPQTDAEQRLARSQQFFDNGNSVNARGRRVARAVGQEDAIGLEGQY